MKNIFISISVSVFFFISICLNAQTYSAKIKENSPELYRAIANKAEKEWPNDYQMQAYVIDQQCDAFFEFVSLKAEKVGIPNEVFGRIQLDALKEWSVNSYEDCKNEKETFACLDADWTMVVYVIKNQIEAYKELH